MKDVAWSVCIEEREERWFDRRTGARSILLEVVAPKVEFALP